MLRDVTVHQHYIWVFSWYLYCLTHLLPRAHMIVRLLEKRLLLKCLRSLSLAFFALLILFASVCVCCGSGRPTVLPYYGCVFSLCVDPCSKRLEMVYATSWEVVSRREKDIIYLFIYLANSLPCRLTTTKTLFLS